MESYIDISDSEFGCVEAGEDESGGRSPSPRPRGSVGPRHSLATIGKLAYVAIDYFSYFHRVSFLKLFCFF